ncbi:MAG: DUF805 domain-containing protein [Muribaculaceae bacterium]
MKTISIYQVEENPIGTGGMGRVMRGVDPQGRDIAIKEILPEFASDLEIRTRTEREVEILEILNNTEGVVKVYDRFPFNYNFYIVMEFIDGMNVEQYVQKFGSVPYERAVRLMIKILDIMQSVHEKEIVHRDMKPSNIMIRDDERVCILDFGIAKDLGNNNGNTTVYGTILGSDGYMSPEQAEGFSIDHRADIYALGCVLYYMLTGHHAFNTLATDFEMRSAIANSPFPKLSKNSKKAFPAKMQDVLDRATDKNMMKRYQSCREFRKDLEALLQPTIVSNSKMESIFVTVGREGCDVLVEDVTNKVSRSHLDVTYKQFTGGRYYVITDHSSNGTMVNGRRLHRGESEHIPVDAVDPYVCLACDPNLILDWNEVKNKIAEKIKEGPVGETIVPELPKVEIETEPMVSKNINIIDAYKLFFTRAFDFKGRSRRKEYWYVTLVNFVLQIPIVIASVMTALYGSARDVDTIAGISMVFTLICLIPGISLTVRRLHDIGKSWTACLWWLLGLIPIVNLVAIPVLTVIWIIWMTNDSQSGENEWGPCPK